MAGSNDRTGGKRAQNAVTGTWSDVGHRKDMRFGSLKATWVGPGLRVPLAMRPAVVFEGGRESKEE